MKNTMGTGQDLMVDLESFFSARLSRLYPEKKSGGYAKLMADREKLLEQLRVVFSGEGDLKAFGEMNDLALRMIGEAVDVSYKQGFFDGIKFITQIMAN